MLTYLTHSLHFCHATRRLLHRDRVGAAQQAAADAQWARHTCRRVVSRWLFYTQQSRLLGVDLPSPSTTSSSRCSSPEAAAAAVRWVPCLAHDGGDEDDGSQASAAAGATTSGFGGASKFHLVQKQAKGAARSLASRFALPRHSQMQPQQGLTGATQHHLQPDQQQQDGPVCAVLPAQMHSGASTSLASLMERLGGALGCRSSSNQLAEPPSLAFMHGAPSSRGSSSQGRHSFGGLLHAINSSNSGSNSSHHRVLPTVMEGHAAGDTFTQSCRMSALISPPRHRASLPGLQPEGHPAGSSSHPYSVGGAQARRQSAGGFVRGLSTSAPGLPPAPGTGGLAVAIDSSLSVPLALQAGFVAAARSQRMRRRWLLVKVLSRCVAGASRSTCKSCSSRGHFAHCLVSAAVAPAAVALCTDCDRCSPPCSSVCCRLYQLCHALLAVVLCAMFPLLHYTMICSAVLSCAGRLLQVAPAA